SDLDLFLSNGKSFIHTNNMHFGITLEDAPLISGDFNGDGRLDEINRPYYHSTFDIFHFDVVTATSFNQEFLLWEIVSGNGAVTRFRYKPLTSDGTHIQTENSSYPLIFGQDPIPVVTSTEVSKGKESTAGYFTKYYQYEDAAFHKEGRGFLGFKKINIHDV